MAAAAVELVRKTVARKGTLRGFEVDDAARGFIRDQGFGEYFVHRTGHSIGREVHGAGANMEVNVYVGDGEAFVTGEVQEAPVLI